MGWSKPHRERGVLRGAVWPVQCSRRHGVCRTRARPLVSTAAARDQSAATRPRPVACVIHPAAHHAQPSASPHTPSPPPPPILSRPRGLAQGLSGVQETLAEQSFESDQRRESKGVWRGGEVEQQGFPSHTWQQHAGVCASADGVASPAGGLPQRLARGVTSPRCMRLHRAGGSGVHRDAGWKGGEGVD